MTTVEATVADSTGTQELIAAARALKPTLARNAAEAEVQRRLRQPRVAPVQQGGAELVQPADGPVQQRPDDRLGGRLPGQGVQVALHDSRGVLFVHGRPPPEGGGVRPGRCPPPALIGMGCHPPSRHFIPGAVHQPR